VIERLKAALAVVLPTSLGNSIRGRCHVKLFSALLSQDIKLGTVLIDGTPTK
jgi:hypothetical protein